MRSRRRRSQPPLQLPMKTITTNNNNNNNRNNNDAVDDGIDDNGDGSDSGDNYSAIFSASTKFAGGDRTMLQDSYQSRPQEAVPVAHNYFHNHGTGLNYVLPIMHVTSDTPRCINV